MKQKKLTEADLILDQFVTGYHEYSLEEPVRLTRASRNLCGMVQYSEEELVSQETDLYLPLVHPADNGRYRCFLDILKREEGTQTLEYRLLRRDGEVLYVKDTMTSRKLADGTMEGYSVLADVTGLKNEIENVRIINDTVPCGLLRYTCEKTPRVTYVNDQMIRIMRVLDQPGEGIDPVELYKSNIYLMISAENRSRFAQVLQHVYMTGKPYAGELSVVKGDGSKGVLFGWITKQKNSSGVDEFQSICMDVTERHERKKTEQVEHYLNALKGIYDLVFEFDRENGTVRYLYGELPHMSEYLEGIPMQLEVATEKWLDHVVVKEDAARLRSFLFRNIFRTGQSSDNMAQICFRYHMADGREGQYQSVLLKAGPSLLYFCCREAEQTAEADILKQENDTLADQNREIRELVRRFTDGVVGFEIEGDQVKPLYLSDNVYAFFGFSEKEWARMAREGITIREFVAGTGVEYEKYEELFRNGEAEYVYTDVASGRRQKIRAVCSDLDTDSNEKKYVMLYRADGASKQEESSGNALVQIRTFGYFDVFVSGKPIMFKTEKAKELLAILVDRKGGYVTPEEAISILWEDEPASPVVLARYRKVALRLKNQLEEYGVPEIVESVSGKRRLVTELVDCDLYQYLASPEENAGKFHGNYLTNYSWGETTLGELL